MTNEDLWQAVLAQIQFHISKANFGTWFANTKIILKKDGEVIVSVPNSFSKEWLENKYNKLILKILRELNSEIKEVKYKIKPLSLKALKNIDISHETEIDQLKFKEFNTDKDSDLNPRYVFDNFIVGSFNELAQAAGWAVSKNPGTIYNPFFVYGGVGLGKTHLLQAIGNEIHKNFEQKKVRYLPSERLTSQIVNAIRNKNIDNLKTNLSQIDILIIDDVQFLAGKEKTQEEFFHLFNSLYEKNKQIILSSDRSPKAIPALEQRLRSRFEGGMIADIGLPDFETRIAILKNKSQERKIELKKEILEYIASNIKKNIREMEGALNRIMAYQRLNHSLPNLEVTKNLLKNFILSPSKVTNYKRIIQAVAEFYDLKEKEILSSTRKKEIVKPRQIAMYLLRNELKTSFPFIGKKFGGKDHTTAIYACKKIKKELKEDSKLSNELELIKERIYCF